MQAVGVAPALHHAAGELVDDDDLAVLDDVVDVAREQLVGAQRLVDVVHAAMTVVGVVEAVPSGSSPSPRSDVLDRLGAGLGQDDRARSSRPSRSARPSSCGITRVDAAVELGGILGRAGDDQRRARLVDQDRIDLVDDGVVEGPLDHVVQPVLHVVAQVVEAELVVGAVGDVAGVGRLALLVVELVHDHADGEAEEACRSGPSTRRRAWPGSR